MKFSARSLSALAVSLSVWSVQAKAAETEVVSTEDDSTAPSQQEILVTATRSFTPIDATPRSISIVAPSTLEERPGVGGIQSLLAETPGITFARTGGLGGQLVIRGFNSGGARSVLSLDGDRFRGRTSLEYNLIDPNSIERIEIIRGPASSILGPDAMNGVVNVVTRRAKVDISQPFTLAPHVRALEFNSVNSMFGGRAEIVGGGDGFDVLIGGNIRKARDYDTPLGKAENSDYFSRGLDFRIGYSPDTSQRFEVAGRYQLANAGQAHAPGAPILEIWQDPLEEKFLRLGYNRTDTGGISDELDVSVYVRHLNTDIYQLSRADPEETTLAHIVNHTPTVYGGHLTANKKIDGHSLSYGIDGFFEDFRGRQRENTKIDPVTGLVKSTSPLARQERGSKQTSFGAFINDDWAVAPGFRLSAGLRVDWIRTRLDSTPLPGETKERQEVFAAALRTTSVPITGSIGSIIDLSSGLQLVSNISRGFRAPSGQDKAMTATTAGITTLPAPTLRPEKNTNYELGFRVRGDGHRVNLTAFRSDYKDLIRVASLNATTRQRQNVDSARVQGIELEGDWQLTPQLSARYMATATRGTDTSSGRPLSHIAPLFGRVALRYDGGNWYSEGVVRASKGKSRIDTTVERPTDDYAIVDLYVGFDIGKIGGDAWRAVIGLENAFNSVARNPAVGEDIRYSNKLIGNPLIEPGRAFVVKLSAQY